MSSVGKKKLRAKIHAWTNEFGHYDYSWVGEQTRCLGEVEVSGSLDIVEVPGSLDPSFDVYPSFTITIICY
jgi:hypothetical protein